MFAATLRPHRSLGPKGTALVIGFAALISLSTTIPFALAGAWPVGGFLGLDVALLFFAFRANNRQARAYEEVVLSRIELILRKVSWRGVAREWRFNPLWVRIRTEEDAEYGLMHLAVAERGRELAVGECLGPAERADFAQAFRKALAQARR